MIYLRTTDRQTVNNNSTIHALELIYFDSNTEYMTKTHLKSSASSNFLPLHKRNPSIVGLFRICLHVIVTSFKRHNDVTPSNTMTDVFNIAVAIDMS